MFEVSAASAQAHTMVGTPYYMSPELLQVIDVFQVRIDSSHALILDRLQGCTKHTP